MRTAPLNSLSMRTRMLHLGRDADTQRGFVNMPAFRGSTVLYDTMDDLLARRAPFRYGSKGTPTTQALESAWNELTGAAGTVLVPSGSAACALALLTCLSAGRHALVSDGVYLPTRQFCDQILPRFGIRVTYYDPLVGPGISNLIQDDTSVVFVEAPSSQTFEVPDVPAIAASAHARDVTVILDNTWATPILFPAHDRGVDIAIEAGTKYLSGHSDLMLGLVSANASHHGQLRATYEAMAINPGPEDVVLALRGLRTMHLRLDRQGAAALELARWLETRREVKRVLHPALPSSESHGLWKRDFLGSSGVFSVILEPVSRPALAAMIDGLRLFGMGFSWGGYESLVVPFDGASHRTIRRPPSEGIYLRFQIGLEDLDELKDDLAAGFSRLNGVMDGR